MLSLHFNTFCTDSSTAAYLYLQTTVNITTGYIDSKPAVCSTHIHITVCTFREQRFVHITCTHLPPYQISHGCSKPTVVLVTENSTELMQSRHLAISLSITIYTQ